MFYDLSKATTEEKAKVIVQSIVRLKEQFGIDDVSEIGPAIEGIIQGFNSFIDLAEINDSKTLFDVNKSVQNLADYLSKENRAKLEMEILERELENNPSVVNKRRQKV